MKRDVSLTLCWKFMFISILAMLAFPGGRAPREDH